MRNTIRPRQTSAFPPTAEIPSNATSFSGNPQPDPPEMFNILLALESARGLLTVRDVAELLGKSHILDLSDGSSSGRFRH